MPLFKRRQREPARESGPRGYLIPVRAGPPLLPSGLKELRGTWERVAQAYGEEWGRPTRLLPEVQLPQLGNLSSWPEIYQDIGLRECQRAGIPFQEERDTFSFEPAGPTMGFVKVLINEDQPGPSG